MGGIAAGPKAAQGGAMAPVVGMDARRTEGGAAVWIPWMAAAAMLIVAVLLGLRVRSLNDELRRQSDLAAAQAAENSRAHEVLEVLTAPSAQRVLLTASKAKPVPTGRAIYLAESGALIFQANDLERIAKNETYWVWVILA